MMGKTHASSSLAVWLVAASPLDHAIGLTGGQIVLGAAMAAGAGLLPDVDQGHVSIKFAAGFIPYPASGGATIARTYGLVTAIPAWLIGKATGGHRNGTHSLLGHLVFILVAVWAAYAQGWPLAVALWLLLGFALRSFDIAVPGQITATALAHAVLLAGVVFLLWTSGIDSAEVLPWTVGVGCFTHTLLGDCLTKQRCPLLWPLSKARHGFDLVGTNSVTERRVVFPVAVATSVLLGLWLSGIGPGLLALA